MTVQDLLKRAGISSIEELNDPSIGARVADLIGGGGGVRPVGMGAGVDPMNPSPGVRTNGKGTFFSFDPEERNRIINERNAVAINQQIAARHAQDPSWYPSNTNSPLDMAGDMRKMELAKKVLQFKEQGEQKDWFVRTLREKIARRDIFQNPQDGSWQEVVDEPDELGQMKKVIRPISLETAGMLAKVGGPDALGLPDVKQMNALKNVVTLGRTEGLPLGGTLNIEERNYLKNMKMPNGQEPFIGGNSLPLGGTLDQQERDHLLSIEATFPKGYRPYISENGPYFNPSGLKDYKSGPVPLPPSETPAEDRPYPPLAGIPQAIGNLNESDVRNTYRRRLEDGSGKIPLDSIIGTVVKNLIKRLVTGGTPEQTADVTDDRTERQMIDILRERRGLGPISEAMWQEYLANRANKQSNRDTFNSPTPINRQTIPRPRY